MLRTGDPLAYNWTGKFASILRRDPMLKWVYTVTQKRNDLGGKKLG